MRSAALKEVRQITVIAGAVRRALELVQDQHSPWDSANLGGACGIAASSMVAMLKNHEIDSILSFGGDSWSAHCWTELKIDNTLCVIDVTATQFDSSVSPVIVMPRQKYSEFSWIIPYIGKYADVKRGFPAKMELSKWTHEQQPVTWQDHVVEVASAHLRNVRGQLRLQAVV